MYNLNQMNENFETIKTFCGLYRKELTIYSGIVLDNGLNDICELDDYISFMNSLSFEEFTGNYLIMLLNQDAIDTVKPIINGEVKFEDSDMFSLFNDEFKNELAKRKND